MNNKPPKNMIYLVVGMIFFAASCYPYIHYRFFIWKTERAQLKYKKTVEEYLPDMIEEFDTAVSDIIVNVVNSAEYGVKHFKIDHLFDEYTSTVNVDITLQDTEDDEYMCDRYAEYYTEIRSMITDITERKCKGIYTDKDSFGSINNCNWELEKYISFTVHTDRHCLTSENKYNHVGPSQISDLKTGRLYEQDFNKSRGSKWVNDITIAADKKMEQIEWDIAYRKKKTAEDKAKAENTPRKYNSYRNNTSKSKSKRTYGGNSYDDGYDVIYDEGDYDDKRYENDDDYALGVDDAMDEMGEYW